MRIQFQSWSIPLIIPLFLVSRLTWFASLYDLQFQRKLVKKYAVRLLFVSQDGRTTLYLSSFLITYRTCCFGIDPCPKRRSRKIKKHLNSYIIIVCIIVHIKEGKKQEWVCATYEVVFLSSTEMLWLSSWIFTCIIGICKVSCSLFLQWYLAQGYSVHYRVQGKGWWKR